MQNEKLTSLNFNDFYFRERQYLILFGPPRSGTTILNERVARSLGETQFPEVDHILNTIINYKTCKGLPNDRLYRFFDKDQKQIRETYKELLRVLLKPCFEQTREYITLKNPFWAGYIPETIELFEDEKVKYIATVRHPLDIVSSWKVVQEKSKTVFNLEDTIELFSTMFQQIVDLIQNNFNGSDNFFLCKYEDFASGNNKMELEAFLKHEIDLLSPSRMDWSKKLDRRLQPFVTSQYANGINTNSISNYLEVLNDKEIEQVKRKMKKYIKYFGY